MFTSEQEGMVRDYLKRAAAIYFGLTPTEVSVGGKRLRRATQAHMYAMHILLKMNIFMNK